jgi:dihydroorotase
VVDLLCHGPQRLYNIRGKGRLVVGYDADITLVDLKEKRTVRHADMATRVGWTPFDGMELTGWPVATLVRGHQVMRDGELLKRAAEPVRFS